MKKIPLLLTLAILGHVVHAQNIFDLKADSVRITNFSKPAELNLENSTKHIKGFLYNKGNGRTEFRRVIKLNDSTVIFGEDTLSIGGAYSFSNGITRSGSNIKMGGAITEPVTLTANTPTTLNVENSGNGYGLTAYSYGGTGVSGTSATGIGMEALGYTYGINATAAALNGVAVSGVSVGKAFDLRTNYIQPGSSVTTIGNFRKLAIGLLPPADGWGLALDFNLSTVRENDREAGRFVYKWTTVADASRTSAFELYTVNNATLGRKAMLAGNGQWTWDGYPALPAQTDSETYKPLAIDDSGRVVKMSGWAGGSGGSALNLQQVTNVGNTTTKYINADSGYYQRGITLLHATDGILRVGYNAGIANTSGPGNTAVGNNSLQSNTTGNGNTAVGYNTLKSTTVSSRNVAVGAFALTNNTGLDNTGLGWFALNANTNGFVNTAVGSSAMSSNTTGADNTAIGASALRTNTTGHFNNAIGAGALLASNGIGNNAMGWSAMQNAGSVNYNVGIGDSVLFNNITGSGNTALGRAAGHNITSGSQNIAIGYRAYVPSPTASNQLSIGNLIYGTGLDGSGPSVSNGKIGIKTQAPAYELDVNGKLGVRTIDSTATAANMLYQDAATGEIKKAAYQGKQTFAQTATATVTSNIETTLIAAGNGSLTIPAASWVVGKSYRVVVRGVYSTPPTNPANFIFKIKLGSTVIAQTASVFVGSSKTNVPYELRAEMTCRGTGASGSVFTMGTVYVNDGLDKLDNGINASTVNLSTDQTLDVTVKLSDATTGNGISAFIVLFEAIN